MPWNSSDKAAGVTLSGGDLIATATVSAGVRAGVRGTTSHHIGKWYFTVQWTAPSGSSNTWSAGLADASWDLARFVGNDTHGIGCLSNLVNNVYFNSNSGTGQYFPSLGINDRLVIAMYGDLNLVWFTGIVSGVLQTPWSGPGLGNQTGVPATSTQGIDISSLNATAVFPAFCGGNDDADTYIGVLDTTTVISDSSLAGFSPWDSGEGAEILMGQAVM